MKTLLATVGAALTAITLGAAEAESEKVETETEETPLFEAGFDVDYFSAYVWRNAVMNDRMVLEPSVWADFTALDPFWFGFFIWQNYDLTDRRGDAHRRGLTETDYNVHVGATAWTDDDETMAVELEFGHEWFDSHFVDRDFRSSYCDTREFYLKAKFKNPVVDVYGQVSWLYGDFGDYQQGVHYEIGLNKELELVEDALTLGFDLNVNFGDSHYLYFLYDGVNWDEDLEDCDNPDGGIGGMTAKIYASWKLAKWVALKGTIAYTGIVDGDIRRAHGDLDDENRDLIWGGVSLNFEF